MVQIDIEKLSKELGIPRVPKDAPIYTTAPMLHFTSRSGKSTTSTQKGSASPSEKPKT